MLADFQYSMSLLLSTTDDGTPIPSSNSIETSLYADVPKEDEGVDVVGDADETDNDEADAKDALSIPSSMSVVSPDANRTPTEIKRAPIPISTSTTTPAPTTDNVYLQVARVLLFAVILLSVAYLIYWVMQNVYNIDPIAKLTSLVEDTPLANFSKPLNQLATTGATVGATVLASGAMGTTPPKTHHTTDQIPLSAPEYSNTDAPSNVGYSDDANEEPTQTPTHGPSPSQQPPRPQHGVSSFIGPLQEMFRQTNSASAPHTDGTSRQPVPLMAQGTQMKKTLTDKSVSVLLDMMSQIQ